MLFQFPILTIYLTSLWRQTLTHTQFRYNNPYFCTIVFEEKVRCCSNFQSLFLIEPCDCKQDLFRSPIHREPLICIWRPHRNYQLFNYSNIMLYPTRSSTLPHFYPFSFDYKQTWPILADKVKEDSLEPYSTTQMIFSCTYLVSQRLLFLKRKNWCNRWSQGGS